MRSRVTSTLKPVLANRLRFLPTKEQGEFSYNFAWP
jgi:hypothetical protein